MISCVAGITLSGICHSALWAVAQPTQTPSQVPAPIVDVGGNQALWFIVILAGATALLWAFPLFYDAVQANRWRRDQQAYLLGRMVNSAGRLSVEEIRQIASAIDTPPRGTQGLTQSLLALLIVTFVGVAMLGTLVSTATGADDLRKTIIASLLSILATIVGFYFGARTAQSAAEQATRPPEAHGHRTANGIPRIRSVQPNIGQASGGTPVVLTGSGFLGAKEAKFGPTSATGFTVESDELIRAVSPPGRGTVEVTVTTAVGTSASNPAARFTYGDLAE
jgi:hypothetical protein